MKTVEQLLKQRDKLFNDQSAAIVERIETTLDGIREFLVDTDPSYEPGIFYWEDVAIFEELLMLVGVVKYDPGAKFILDGELIEITKDNQNYFDRVLRIGIPFVIVNQCDPRTVYSFLSQLHSAVAEADALAMETAIREEAEDELDAVESARLVPIKLKEDDKFQFDIDDLTDSQREALMLHKKSGKMN